MLFDRLSARPKPPSILKYAFFFLASSDFPHCPEYPHAQYLRFSVAPFEFEVPLSCPLLLRYLFFRPNFPPCQYYFYVTPTKGLTKMVMTKRRQDFRDISGHIDFFV